MQKNRGGSRRKPNQINHLDFARRTAKHLLALIIAFVALAIPASAHVGSPDVFLEDNAGPYKLFVTVRVPQVIPGIAQIEIRSETNDVQEIRLAPMQLTGPGSQFAPAPDVAQRSKTDPQFFTGSLWLMEFGSLQVRIEASGTRGAGQLAVPVPAVAQRMLPMRKSLGIALSLLMVVLAFALVSIAGAAVREGNLEPGAALKPANVRRARIRYGGGKHHRDCASVRRRRVVEVGGGPLRRQRLQHSGDAGGSQSRRAIGFARKAGAVGGRKSSARCRGDRL